MKTKHFFLLTYLSFAAMVSFSQAPAIQLGNLSVGTDTTNFDSIKELNVVHLVNADGTAQRDCAIVSGSLYVTGQRGQGKVYADGSIDAVGLKMIKKSKGKNIFVEISYTDASGKNRINSQTYYVQ